MNSRVKEVSSMDLEPNLPVEQCLWIQAIALLRCDAKATSSGIRARQMFPTSNLGEDVKRQWSFYW